jgi:hypothetical protein
MRIGRGMKDSESVPIGSPVGLIKPPVAIGPPIKSSEPIGDKNRLTTMALRISCCAGLGKERVKL